MLGFGKKKSKNGEDQEKQNGAAEGSPPDKGDSPPGDGGADGQLEFSPDDKAKARKWFQQAKVVGETRNYDYAIECYITGLSYWPEAVEEGHRPLFGIALARKHAGGKKPGMKEGFKLNMNDKDPKQAMLNAETLFAKDSNNLMYVDGIFRNANKGRFDETMTFVGTIYWDLLQREKKPKESQLRQLKDLYEELGDRFQTRHDQARAVQAYERAVRPLELLIQNKPNDLDLMNTLRNLTSKLTITKGKYEEAGSFRDSVRDKDQQKDLQDKDRLLQSDDRLEKLVAQAREDMERNPGVAAKVITLVDLLTRRESDDSENEAIGILNDRYEKTQDYRFKLRADDIRMRQLNRHHREVQKRGDRDAEKQALRKLLKFEIGVFRERAGQYPTDMRIRFQLAIRLMRAGLYEEAIPAFQAARADPKHRLRSNISIGRCFHEKGLYGQAIDLFRQAMEDVQLQGDETSRELHYWMGRSYEADDKVEEALKVYGQVLTWDYNYKDVRERVDRLRSKG
jgi:tetratricopeptide (TPR) repeat protein